MKTAALEQRAEKLVEGVDYYVDRGCLVFTAAYHRRRGWCCARGCRHCPFRFEQERPSTTDAPATLLVACEQRATKR